MIELAEIQGKIRSLIQADTFFSGVPVILNMGLSSHEIEDALLKPACGCVVIVQPILGGTGPSQAGAAVSTVKVDVSIQINPVTNLTGKKLNVYEAIKHVCTAVLASEPEKGGGRFELDAENQFGLEDVGGLLAYTITFTKKTKLA